MKISASALRAYAVTRTLLQPNDLATAIERLGFVQIDPIRAPARAQDLILRHRVKDYRVGDLASRFAELQLVEDFLHVYGVLPATSLRLLHPRLRQRIWRVEREHPRLARKILDHIGRSGIAHPRDLTRALGTTTIVNGWGGSSAATTRMLEALHYRGALRVLRRDGGVKVYGLAAPFEAPLSLPVRGDEILRMLVRLYAPLSIPVLRQLAAMVGRDSLPEATRIRAFTRLLKSDWLGRAVVDDIEYVWPAGEGVPDEAPDSVKLLAPFDPIVWDRRRFEHLWGWDYRFEAYTPAAKRRYGYYALPLLWRDRVVGWANVVSTSRGFDVQTGFADRKPRDVRFGRELDREINALSRSLSV